MAWISPIYNRTLQDIIDKTAKGYFNQADFNRIYGNSQEINFQLQYLRDVYVDFDILTAPTDTTFGTKALINALIGNIERVRAASGLPLTDQLIQLKTDWGEGTGADAPDYEDVNSWELVEEIIFKWLYTSYLYMVHSGVATVGQSRHWQSRFRSG